MLIQLRYNTECGDGPLYWRVLIDGVEHLAVNVHIDVPAQTTRDLLPDKGVFKHHISCSSVNIRWIDNVLFVS